MSRELVAHAVATLSRFDLETIEKLRAGVGAASAEERGLID